MSSCPKKTRGFGIGKWCNQTKFTEKLIVDEPIPYKQCVFLDVGVSRYIYIYNIRFFLGGGRVGTLPKTNIGSKK